MIKITEKNSEESNQVVNIIKGSLISILITIVLLFVFSICLTYTRTSESTIPVVTIIVTFISILLGSQLTMAHVKKNGIINGGLIGAIYIIIIYLISSVVSKNFGMNVYSLIMATLSILAGATGGMIGVNLK